MSEYECPEDEGARGRYKKILSAIEVIFASARPIKDMLPVLDKRFQRCPWIGGNGSLIAVDGQIKYRHAFSDAMRSQFMHLIQEQEVTYLIDGDWDYAYTGPPDHPILLNVNGARAARNVPVEALRSIVMPMISRCSSMRSIP
ncbi:hypothetical protein PRECH8_25500 [Insulibacter thermoxylanivorax]|uniref:Uncharacterized protein n=1 Tax=Insulibacter thermoxylanivorax TaxID=2749268 RepID=A0A916QGI6_9BACL|nr:HAD hydrolase family protein [Insulibacter thermoxylanivorax]GFR39254.1 hypothetical protein PRECH8_25500 [Insulibacter thermoxylanivorax]